MAQLSVFCVCVKCDRIVATVDGQSGVYGFYKNEYVRASMPREAEDAAMIKVRAALERNPDIGAAGAKNATLEIDEVEGGFDESALSNEAGFVYFKSETG